MADSNAPAPVVPAHHAAPTLNELRAGVFMVSAAACFALAFALVKWLTAELPEAVLTLWRSVFAVIVFLPMVLRAGPRPFLTTPDDRAPHGPFLAGRRWLFELPAVRLRAGTAAARTSAARPSR